MFVLRFHNTFLLKLGILGLVVNLNLFSFNVFASGMTAAASQIDIKAIEQEAKRLEEEYSTALTEFKKPRGSSLHRSDYKEKRKAFLYHLTQYPDTLNLFQLEKFEDLYNEVKDGSLQVMYGSLYDRSSLLAFSSCNKIVRAYRFSDPKISLVQFYADRVCKLPKDCPFDEKWGAMETFCSFLFHMWDPLLTPSELNLMAPVQFWIFYEYTPKSLRNVYFYSPYRNQLGQNILHLIPTEDFDKFSKSVEADVMLGKLLVAPDKYGALSLFRYMCNPLSPDFIRILTNIIEPYSTTLATHLALTRVDFHQILEDLRKLGVTFGKEDNFGNTEETIYEANRDNNLPSLLTRAYVNLGLNDSLWEKIKEEGVPYINALKKIKNAKEPEMFASEFADAALLVVQNQHQTELHRAFWQLDTSNAALRAESNRLWKSFFETYDSMPKEPDKDAEPALPLSGRVLNAVCSERLLHLQETRATIISGASNFGIKFRKATPKEAKVMVNGIYHIVSASVDNCLLNAIGKGFRLNYPTGSIAKKYEALLRKTEELKNCNEIQVIRHLSSDGSMDFQSGIDTAFMQEVNVIRHMFFKPYHEPLDKDKAARLLRHQLKCTVIALAKFDEARYLAKGVSKSAIDQNKVFRFIDETLQDDMPAGVNARALYLNVKDHLHPDDSFLLSF